MVRSKESPRGNVCWFLNNFPVSNICCVHPTKSAVRKPKPNQLSRQRSTLCVYHKKQNKNARRQGFEVIQTTTTPPPQLLARGHAYHTCHAEALFGLEKFGHQVPTTDSATTFKSLAVKNFSLKNKSNICTHLKCPDKNLYPSTYIYTKTAAPQTNKRASGQIKRFLRDAICSPQ